MKIQFCGAARTVTGSCYFIDTGKVKILVDCGAFQGSEQLGEMNYDEFPFNPAEIDYVIITHGHYDHVGRTPILMKQGFTGKYICTPATKELAELILLDSAHLQKEAHRRWLVRSKKRAEREAEKKGVTVIKQEDQQGSAYEQRKPLYEEEDVTEMMQMFETHEYGQSVQITDGVEMRLRNAGHIIGSASVELWLTNASGKARKIVFSGDLGQPGARIIKDPDMIREADYVVCESTYGNRLHKSKDETLVELLAILKQAQEDRGMVLIPTFAVERAQELLYEMNLFIENKLLNNVETYLDSPMAIRATQIFVKHPELYDEDARRLLEKGDDPFKFPGLKMSMTSDESKRLIAVKHAVIMAGSGMCTGGRIVHHLVNNITNPNTHVVFAGYQVKGTLGRRIVDGDPRVKIMGRSYDVKAHIHTLGGFSAHGDERDLRYWLRGFGNSPRKIFITHGEESIAINFAHNIGQELNVESEAPKMLEIVELD